jgi:transglutaminase-like putative cysteine protease
MSTRQSAVVDWLRAGVFACAVGTLVGPLSTGAAVALAMLGSAAAVRAADLLSARSLAPRLRTGGIWLGAVFLTLIGLGFARFLSNATALAGLAGPVPLIHASEALLWCAAVMPPLFALRFTARRHPVAVALEVGLAAAAFGIALAGHRRGMLHRPFALGDWIWQWGLDPTLVLLAVGGAATLLLALLLVSEARPRRIPLHLSVLALVALLIAALVRLNGLPQPDPPGSGAAEVEQARGEQGRLEQSASGRSNDWDFHDEFETDLDERPVAIVVFHDDYSPEIGSYFFRQAALSQWNGRRLVRATRDDVDRDIPRAFPAARMRVEGAPRSDGREPLETTTGLLVDHTRPFALDAPDWLEPVESRSLRFQRAYAALSQVPTTTFPDLLGRGSGDEEWSPSIREHYTMGPDDPRYAQLAASIRDALPRSLRDDPLALALAVKVYLDEQGFYSLKNRHASAEDPTASFLFGDLTGYCVHFAHASTFLLRALDVPARVATGYAVPARDGYGGSALLIRALNAHAWPEVHIAGAGWTSVDPTPHRSDLAGVPAVDPELQRLLGELLRGQLDPNAPHIANAEPSFTARAILVFLGGSALCCVLLGYAIRISRQLTGRFASAQSAPRLVYRATLDRLASVGWRRHFGESRERFAGRTRRVAPSLDALTGVHLRWALGDDGSNADPSQLHSLAREVRAELRATVPAWRRALALFDPFCWWRTR